MKIFAIVPVKKFENSKTRLSSMLTLDERIILSSLMLSSTLEVLACASLTEMVVVSSDRRVQGIASEHGARFLYEEKEKGVNSAVAIADSYCVKQGGDATIVVPEDLPLLDTTDIMMVCDLVANEGRCIVICPSSRYDGTNLLFRKPPDAMRTHYDNNSYITHIDIAKKLGIPVKIFFSKRLMYDIDTPEDVKQLAGGCSRSKTIEFLKQKAGRLSVT